MLGSGECVHTNPAGPLPRTSGGVPTVAACAGLCSHFGCIAFEFWYAAEQCELFLGGSTVGAFAAPAGGVHAACFAAGSPAPPPPTYTVQPTDELFAPAYNGPCQSKVPSRGPRFVSLEDGEPQSVCQALCTADPRCTGYSYAPTQTRCKLHFLPLSRYPGPTNTDGVACHVKQPGALSPATVEVDELRWVRRTSTPVALSSSVSSVVGESLYVFGRAGTDCVGFKYSLSTLSWTLLPSPPRCDRGQVIAAAEGGSRDGGAIYLVGGLVSPPDGGSAGVVQKFSTYTSTWETEITPVPFASGAAVVGGTGDGSLVVCGGIVDGDINEECAEYNPIQRAWQLTTDMPIPVHSAAYAIHDGKLFVAGGYVGVGSARIPTDAIQVYTKSTMAWSVSPARLPHSVGGLNAAVFHNGLMYIVGGETGRGVHFHVSATVLGTFTSVTSVDPSNWRVTQESPLLEATHGASVAVDDDGRLYVTGGAHRQGKSCSDAFQVAYRTVAVGNSFFQYVIIFFSEANTIFVDLFNAITAVSTA